MSLSKVMALFGRQRLTLFLEVVGYVCVLPIYSIPYAFVFVYVFMHGNKVLLETPFLLSRVVRRSFPVVTSGHLPGGIIDNNDAMSAAVVASAHGMKDPIPHP